MDYFVKLQKGCWYIFFLNKFKLARSFKWNKYIKFKETLNNKKTCAHFTRSSFKIYSILTHNNKKKKRIRRILKLFFKNFNFYIFYIFFLHNDTIELTCFSNVMTQGHLFKKVIYKHNMVGTTIFILLIDLNWIGFY